MINKINKSRNLKYHVIDSLRLGFRNFPYATELRRLWIDAESGGGEVVMVMKEIDDRRSMIDEHGSSHDP